MKGISLTQNSLYYCARNALRPCAGRLKSLVLFSLLFSFLFSQIAYAVPPPDFLFNVGAQVSQIFAIAVLFLGASFSVSYNFIKTKFLVIKAKKGSFFFVSVLGIVLVSFGVAYGYGWYEQNKAYNEWLAESQTYSELSAESEQQYTGTGSSETDISQLDISSAPNSQDFSIEEGQAFVSNISSEFDSNSSVIFIKDYYGSIVSGDIEHAYDISKKSVDLETFEGWYVNTQKITLDNFTQIDDKTSSLELTLYEGTSYTRYATVMAFKFEDFVPVQIESSSVRVLSEGFLDEESNQVVTEGIEATSEKGDGSSSTDYLVDTGISISNEDFQAVLDSGNDNYIVIDAREDLEYENGYFPGAIHIRYADLQAGRWIELPADKFIYVLCWSGIRGQEVAEFLRTKELTASYLEGGASGWVEYGGEWVGNIDFSEQYSEDRYKITYTSDEVSDYVDDGVVLVDCREPWRYEEWHMEGSINIPIMYTPSVDLEDKFSQVPAGSTVITVCDDYVNCFDAKITGVELESRGYTFIGRYNKPWEYE
ncbi:MAG: rhodanese-like domain-containing protein [Candidatus Gracilibacteria bacterium]